MEYVQVQGTAVPKLGFGTWQLEGNECVQAVRGALEIGYRHIDTAVAYDNEEYVGRAIAESGFKRNQLFLTTKIWWEDLSKEAINKSIETSLKKLRTDYIDLALIHWPNEDAGIASPIQSLATLRHDGKLRHFGVSNFTPSHIQRAIEVGAIACNQVEYHPYLSQATHIDLARQHHYMLTAYCPLAKGKVNDDKVLKAIGEKHNKSPAQISLRWLIQQNPVVAIPKAASSEHARDNFDIFDFKLSEDEMQQIHALACDDRLIEPDFAPKWGT